MFKFSTHAAVIGIIVLFLGMYLGGPSKYGPGGFRTSFLRPDPRWSRFYGHASYRGCAINRAY